MTKTEGGGKKMGIHACTPSACLHVYFSRLDSAFALRRSIALIESTWGQAFSHLEARPVDRLHNPANRSLQFEPLGLHSFGARRYHLGSTRTQRRLLSMKASHQIKFLNSSRHAESNTPGPVTTEPTVNASISDADASCAISSSTCKSLPGATMAPKPLDISFMDLKHELYPESRKQLDLDLQSQDIPLPPPSINFTAQPGTPSSRTSNLLDLNATKNDPSSDMGLHLSCSESFPSSISQSPGFVVRERRITEMTERYSGPMAQHGTDQSSVCGAPSSSFSGARVMTISTTTATSVSIPSLSSIDADLITQAIAWLDQDARDLTLSTEPFEPLNQALSSSVTSHISASAIHPTANPSSSDSLSATLSIRYCPQSSDPTQLASPYQPDQRVGYPFLPSSPSKNCDWEHDPCRSPICLTSRRTQPGPKLDATRVCEHNPKCRGEMPPRNESICPAIISAIWAVSIPLGCLICNACWLVESSNRAPIGKAVLALYCYLIVIMLSSMWKAAWSDPGTIPRNLDPDPELDCDEERVPTQQGDIVKEAQSLPKAQVRTRWVNTGEYIVPMKWCSRCRTYRPPRTSHCRICDYCVQQSDHHCTFLNNCIGRDNYFVFIIFLFTTTVAMLSTMAISITHIVFITDLKSSPVAIGNYVVIALAFLLGLPVFGLLVFHIRLISRNVTTMERLRPIIIRDNGVESLAEKEVQLYSVGKWYSNWLWILCTPNFTVGAPNSKINMQPPLGP
ncbi:hypothetical protein PSTG_01027 [Puccinia striiformis f. sp. tritici PST-78]|uniref:Palmitoyltransferase n=1 Tax=Puccinia striiformis f. sp. tritici PST-78 TaxID=1165861 RepID=A0A0L0W3B6_9BASI|nr:hypothetical protein PSTG_01027 [Puccinia striiformis f. sp. tritici PST-78]